MRHDNRLAQHVLAAERTTTAKVRFTALCPHHFARASHAKALGGRFVGFDLKFGHVSPAPLIISFSRLASKSSAWYCLPSLETVRWRRYR